MQKSFFLTAAATSLVIGLGAPGALAIDQADFIAKLTAALKSEGFSTSLENVSVAGDEVTISRVTLAPAGREPIVFERPIILSGVTEDGSGGYFIETAKSQAFTQKADEMDIAIGDMTILKVHVHADADPLSGLDFYKRFETGTIEGTIDGNKVLSIGSVVIDNTYEQEAGKLSSQVAVTGIYADLGEIAKKDQEGTAFLKSFGLETLNAEVKATNNWDLNEGVMQISEAAVDIKDVGRLDVNAEITGYDKALLNALHELQMEVLDHPDASEEETAERSEAIMSKMAEELSLASASIRFDDDSVTNKVLSFIAAQNGTSAAVMAQGFTVSLPMMAMQMGAPPQMQEMLMEAAQKFFTNPQNLEITLTPLEPVQIAKLVGLAANPATLVSTLNLNIVANQ